MLRIELEPADRVGARWRALEAQADGGFFLSWTFLGCLAHERFAGARLLSVTQDGCDVALALVGEADGRLFLNRTGSAALDFPFIEHNGLLVRRGISDPTGAALAHAARHAPLDLAGIGDDVRIQAEAAGWLVVQQTRWAPSVPLGQGPYLDTLSPGTRAQIRRSQRAYGADLHLARADCLAEALDWFGTLSTLHQATWEARGQPGAFATEQMRRFHETLIERGFDRGQIDLLRVSAGNRLVGLLYVFREHGRVLSYQSGFAYDPTRPREKPGLVAHALAIDHYAAAGAGTYDLLAGADRYKLALARGGENLHWATLHRPWSVSGLAARARHRAAQVKAGLIKAGLVKAGLTKAGLHRRRQATTTAPEPRAAPDRPPDRPA